MERKMMLMAFGLSVMGTRAQWQTAGNLGLDPNDNAADVVLLGSVRHRLRQPRSIAG